MRFCIAYESKFGNGKKCVEQLKATLTKKGQTVELVNMRKIKPGSLPEADVYVFSSPTHIGNAPMKVRGFLKKVKIPKAGAKYSIMATHMAPENKMKTLKAMDERLADKGMTKATSDLWIGVKGLKGPLEEGYEKLLEDYASRLISGK